MKHVLDKQTDAELLARYAAGEEAAFRMLVSRYKNSLYVFLRHFLNRQDLIDDVFQETFLQLFTSRESFDEEMSFDDVLNILTSDTTRPYEKLEKGETAARVRQIIANMPENLREILILAYFNKFSYKQMAQILSIPIGTVKSRLHTAVGRFAKEWKASAGSKETK